ncbi:MAG: ABC transporter substrate-binding protein [Hyphomicrobiaceae bacterium]
MFGSLGRRSALAGLAGALTLVLAGGAAHADEKALYEAAKKEGEVNWYTGLIQNQVVRPVVAGFEKKYPGIRVNVTGGRQTELNLKIVNEAKAGRLQADMTEGSTVVQTLKPLGIVEPYFPEAAKNIPGEYKDPEGYWRAIVLYFLVPAINTEMVKPADEPKTLDDLLNPRWKGKMAWSAEMTIGGPPGFIAAVLKVEGEEKGREYLKKLAAQQIKTVPSNPRVVLDQVIAGQYPLALITYNHHSVISAGKGAPVKWLKVNPAVGAMSMSVLLKGPHPNAAKLLINYLISADGAKVIRDANYIPSNPDVPPKDPDLLPQVGKFQAVTPSPDEIEKNIQKWIGIYKEYFQ